MSAVSRDCPVRVEPPARCTTPIHTLRWRVSAAAVAEPAARAWLQATRSPDANLVCEVRNEGGHASCVFSLESESARMVLCDAPAKLTLEGSLTHVDAFDAARNRLLAVTMHGERVLYAVTGMWERLGVAGGRYEVIGSTAENLCRD